MKLFLLNILLAVLWMLMVAQFDLYALLVGFIAGYLLLAIISRATHSEGYATKVWQLLTFTWYFIYILTKANWQVAKEVLSPDRTRVPRIVRYSVDGLTEVQITTLANAITLTPGTLVIDVSPDRQFLYVHCMFAADREGAVRELDELRDRMMDEVF